VKYLLHALNDLLGDASFKRETDRLKAVVEVGGKVKKWVEENNKEAGYFQQQLLRNMRKCFGRGVNTVSKREWVWGDYHKLRASKSYKHFWSVFLSVAGCGTSIDPAFFQHISHHIFTRLLKETFPIQETTYCSSSESDLLTFEEKNAIRYVSGYVCSKVYKKLKKSSESDLALGIVDMVDDEDELDWKDESKLWVDSIDRGGLFKVNDCTYAFFLTLEGVVKRYFQLKKARELEAGTKDLIIDEAIKDEEVKLQWSAIGVELNDTDGASLMRIIIELWVTIRGFSFAGAYIEIYKQASKQSLQKSKGLRTKLSSKKKD
jgi:hypothetical protein